LLSQQDPNSLHLEVSGAMGELIKALAPYPLQDLETENPSLEEVFLAYYQTPGARAGQGGEL
jgi:hypothetical protein